MAVELLNACLLFFIPALVVACIIDHEEAGALIVLAVPFILVRAAVWVKDEIQEITGGSTVEDKWYLSITFYLNILAVIVAVATELFGFGDFEPVPWVDGVVVAVIAIVNLIKHFFPNVKMGPVPL